MTGAGPMDDLIAERGLITDTDSVVTTCAFASDCSNVAFGTVDGDVWLLARGQASAWRGGHWNKVTTCADHAVLTLGADPCGLGFLAGGECKGLYRLTGSGDVSLVCKEQRWVEHVQTWEYEGKGWLLYAAGKKIGLYAYNAGKETWEPVAQFQHDSTISGLALGRPSVGNFFASHYNGVSVYDLARLEDQPKELIWRGSHTSLALHPQGHAVVSAMQEGDLHGWRLPDGHHMRMSGYPRRVESMCFFNDGSWLVTSGAENIILWPFESENGPIGRPPLEAAGIPGVICTRVACHPQYKMVAAGFENGAVLLADIDSERVVLVRRPAQGPIAALAFDSSGTCLAFGAEDGTAGVVDLAART